MFSDVFELVGKVISFQYPASNYEVARKRLERRRLRVDRVRDTEAYPLTADEIAADPNLKRSRFLVMGLDVDKAEPRSFYEGSMEGLEVIDLPRSDVLFFTRENADHIYEADDVIDARWYVGEWEARDKADPLGLGLIPVIVMHQKCTKGAA